MKKKEEEKKDYSIVGHPIIYKPLTITVSGVTDLIPHRFAKTETGSSGEKIAKKQAQDSEVQPVTEKKGKRDPAREIELCKYKDGKEEDRQQGMDVDRTGIDWKGAIWNDCKTNKGE